MQHYYALAKLRAMGEKNEEQKGRFAAEVHDGGAVAQRQSCLLPRRSWCPRSPSRGSRGDGTPEQHVPIHAGMGMGNPGAAHLLRAP